MRRIAAAVTAALTLAACTPEEIAWWTEKVDEARTAGWSCPEAAPLLAYHQLPDHFDSVIWRETRCEPFAINQSSGALGLTQIMPFWLRDLCPLGIACTEADLLDPQKNIAAAAYVYSVQGPSAWSMTWNG